MASKKTIVKSTSRVWWNTGTASAAPSKPTRKEPARPPRSVGYTFVVKQGQGDAQAWKYVRICYETMLGCCTYPMTVFDSVTDDVRDIWKRVVIDGSFYWDEQHVDPKSMRLVKIQAQGHDATSELFDDDGFAKQQRRFAALSKLSPDEAKLLGVEEKYTLMRLFRDQNTNTRADETLADRLREAACDEFSIIDFAKALQSK